MLAGIVVGAMRFSKLSASSRWFFLLLAITPLIELTGYFCALRYRNNSPVSNSFSLIEYSIFCLAFYIDTRIRPVMLLLACGLLFSIGNSLLFQEFLKEQATNTALILSLCQIIIYFLFLILYFKTVDTVSLRQFPMFWIGLGTMVFSIVSIVAFGYLEFGEKGTTWYNVAGYTRKYANYLLYLSYIPAFLSPQKCLYDFTAR